MEIIEQIAEFLESQGIGALQSDIFYSSMPDSSQPSIVVYDTGGPTPDPYLPTKSPTFQVFITAVDYDTGKEKLNLVRSALHQKSNCQLTVGGDYFYFILANSEGGHLGRNNSGLDEFSINFLCKVR